MLLHRLGPGIANHSGSRKTTERPRRRRDLGARDRLPVLHWPIMVYIAGGGTAEGALRRGIQQMVEAIAPRRSQLPPHQRQCGHYAIRAHRTCESVLKRCSAGNSTCDRLQGPAMVNELADADSATLEAIVRLFGALEPPVLNMFDSPRCPKNFFT